MTSQPRDMYLRYALSVRCSSSRGRMCLRTQSRITQVTKIGPRLKRMSLLLEYTIYVRMRKVTAPETMMHQDELCEKLRT